MEDVNNQNLWPFDIGPPQGINVPIFNIFGFQQRDRQNSQNRKNDTFD